MKHLLIFAALATAACHSADSNPDLGTDIAAAPALEFVDPWAAQFVPPTTLDTERMHLEPLGPEHAELDYEAFMSSREHLLATLHWGSWPGPDSTVEGNRQDLGRHQREFLNREGYAYTVLTPDGSRAIGCVYLNKLAESPDGYAVAMAYWVVADQVDTDLDRDLVAAVLDWIEADWPFASVLMPLHLENERGIEIARTRGLAEADEIKDDHRSFTWTR